MRRAGNYTGGLVRPRPKKGFVDRFLLLIEIVAAIGLVFILLYGFSTLKDLNNEVASALEQPTLTPTRVDYGCGSAFRAYSPQLQPVERSTMKLRYQSILRPIVQSLANVPIPTSSPEQATRIQIPCHQGGCTGCDG